MANEVIANAERVVKLAWEGSIALDAMLARYKIENCTQLMRLRSVVTRNSFGRDMAAISDGLVGMRRRALVAHSTISLDGDEAELLGRIADRSFEADLAKAFEREYGAAKE